MATRFYSSVEYGQRNQSNDPDCLYYTADVINNGTDDNIGFQLDPQMTSNQSRQFPLLQNADEYMLTPLRVSSSGATQNLPLWIPRIQQSSVLASFIGNISGNQLTITNAASGILTPGQALFGNGYATLPSTPPSVLAVAIEKTSLGTQLLIQSQNPAVPGQPPSYTLNGTLAPVETGGITYNAYVVNNANMYVGSPQNNPNFTVYSVTIDDVQVFLEWTPENLATPPPSQTVVVQDLSTDYYYGYTYTNFCKMVNTALATAHALSFSAGVVPTINFSTPSYGGALFSIDYEPSAYDLYMNSNLQTLLSNFPGVFVNQLNGRTFRFGTPLGYITGQTSFTQDYPAVSGWSPIQSLIITTSLLPVVPEQVSAPSSVGASNVGESNAVAPAAFQQIIADINIQEINGAQDWRQDFSYEAPGEYRMVSLTNSTGPIQSIDFQCWWRNRLDNNLYPLRLVNGSSITIKLLFRRKQLGV